jgi:plastocyanin
MWQKKSTRAVMTAFAMAALVAAAGVIAFANPARLAAAGTSEQPQVSIDNFSFTPQDITVAPGTTVSWVNHDDVPHTVVSNDKKFKSKALDTDDRFSFTFTEPGTYEYYCSVHPKMTAKITVK